MPIASAANTLGTEATQRRQPKPLTFKARRIVLRFRCIAVESIRPSASSLMINTAKWPPQGRHVDHQRDDRRQDSQILNARGAYIWWCPVCQAKGTELVRCIWMESSSRNFIIAQVMKKSNGLTDSQIATAHHPTHITAYSNQTLT